MGIIKNKHKEEAITVFRKSLSIQEDWNSSHGLGWALFHSKQFKKAIDAFRNSLSIKKDWDSFHGLGWALLNNNQKEEEINAFKESISLEEKSTNGNMTSLFMRPPFKLHQ